MPTANEGSNFFKNFFFYFGFVFIFIFFGFLFWIKKFHELERAEVTTGQYVHGLNIYKQPYYIADAEFLGPDGQIYNTASLKGRYIILNFWATFCSPCIKELPQLGRLQSYFNSNGLNNWQVIAVSVDSNQNMEKAAIFAKNLKVSNIAGYFDYKNQLQNNFQIKNLPVTYIITPKGRILYELKGDVPWLSFEIKDFILKIPGVY